MTPSIKDRAALMDIAYVTKISDIYYVTTTCGQDYSFCHRSAEDGDAPLLVRSHQTWMHWVADPESGPCPAHIVIESNGQPTLVFHV